MLFQVCQVTVAGPERVVDRVYFRETAVLMMLPSPRDDEEAETSQPSSRFMTNGRVCLKASAEAGN